MNDYTPFDEREVCLNCPRKRCIHERNLNAPCPIIKEKREEHRRKKAEKKRREV